MINPYAKTASGRPSFREDSDEAVDNDNDDDDNDATNRDDVSNHSSLSCSVELLLEGMVVPGMQLIPGTQLTPYEGLTAAHRREAVGRNAADSDVSWVDPDHKKWILQCMIEDLGIRYPHEFQICAVHSIAFHRDRLLYLIAKTGLGKSAIPLTIGAM